ncbi:MAG: hypothetical protein EYC70_05050 [Planctomycetota bacterium]|nr:MAG: hypothetical protein EYC70_05050 [Planctomycetota bacterium]
MSTALVLAAGLATRLGSLRERYAKACVPVAGTTPLAFVLQRLHAAGVQRAWVNLHHHGEQVQAEAERSAPPGLELHFLEEARLLGTGGSLLAVAEGDGSLPDLVVNAKIFTDFDFGRALAAPASAVVLHPPGDLALFGGLRHDGAGRVTGLRTAGPPSSEAGTAVFTGISRPSTSWLPALAAAARARPKDAVCLVRDGLLPALQNGADVRALLHAGLWLEVSTPERVAAAAPAVRRLA